MQATMRLIARFFPLYLLVSLLGRAANVISVILLAHEMSVAQFGTFAFLQATAAVAMTLATLNFPVSLNVILSRGTLARLPLENSMLVVLLSGIALVSGPIATIAIAIVAPGTLSVMPEWIWFSLYVSALCLQSLVQAVLYSRASPVISSLSGAFATTVLCIAILLLKVRSVGSALELSALSMLGGVVLASFWIFRGGVIRHSPTVLTAGLSFVRRRGVELIRFSFLTLASGFTFQAALWFIQLRLLAVAGPGQNAPFALGSQFYNVIIFLPTVFAPILLRRMSREESELQRRRDAIIFTGLATVLCMAGIKVFDLSSSTILSVLPDRYGSAVDTIRWAVVAGAIMFAKFPLSVFFQSRLTGSPEALANVMAAALLVCGAMLPTWVSSSMMSMELRAAGHFLQFGCIGAAFVIIGLRHRFVAAEERS